MRRVLIVGNSGSGKSTLAGALTREHGLVHLDLDTLAWLPSEPPPRRDLADSAQEISRFTAQHDAWVIEGCYATKPVIAETLAAADAALAPSVTREPDGAVTFPTSAHVVRWTRPA
jgi:adenylate kinase family enzyme